MDGWMDMMYTCIKVSEREQERARERDTHIKSIRICVMYGYRRTRCKERDRQREREREREIDREIDRERARC